MTPRTFLRALREGYVVILVSLLVAAAIAVVCLVTLPTTYRATALVHVEVALPDDASKSTLTAAVEYANFQTITYEALVTTDPVLTAVIDQTGLDVSVSDLANRVNAVSALDTSIIEIRVSWPDAQDAAVLANAIAQQMSSHVSTSNDALAVELVQVRHAEPDSTPVTPNPAATLGLAAFAAMLVSSAWLFARRIRRAPSRYTEA